MQKHSFFETEVLVYCLLYIFTIENDNTSPTGYKVQLGKNNVKKKLIRRLMPVVSNRL